MKGTLKNTNECIFSTRLNKKERLDKKTTIEKHYIQILKGVTLSILTYLK